MNGVTVSRLVAGSQIKRGKLIAIIDDDDDDDDDGGDDDDDDDDDDGKVEGGLIVEGACCSPLRAKYWLLAFFRSTSTHSWKDGICVRVGSRHIASPIP